MPNKTITLTHGAASMLNGALQVLVEEHPEIFADWIKTVCTKEEWQSLVTQMDEVIHGNKWCDDPDCAYEDNHKNNGEGKFC